MRGKALLEIDDTSDIAAYFDEGASLNQCVLIGHAQMA